MVARVFVFLALLAAPMLRAQDVHVSGTSRGPAYAIGGGTAQAQTVTLNPVRPLVAGLEINFLPNAANTSAGPTLAVNGGSAITITKLGATALAANDLTTTAIASVVYDGTRFQLLNPQTVSSTLRSRTCSIPISVDNASLPLVNADLGPQGRICFIPEAATLTEITVAADAGTPNVIVAKNHAGTPTNLVSSALATAGSGGLACSNTGGTTGIDGATTCSATLQNTTLAKGDWIELVSGTAGGTAKRMSISVTWTVN